MVTLLPIIQAHVAPGIVIHSDRWRAYNQMVHQWHTIRQLIIPVDPTTRIYMEHVESYWNRVKVKFKCMKGCHAHHTWMNSCGGRGMVKQAKQNSIVYYVTLLNSIPCEGYRSVHGDIRIVNAIINTSYTPYTLLVFIPIYSLLCNLHNIQ